MKIGFPLLGAAALSTLASLAACVGDTPVVQTTDAGPDGTVTDGGNPDSPPPTDGSIEAGPPPATGKTLWVRTLPGTEVDGVATDKNGNTYAAGIFYGSQMDFGNGKKLTSSKGADTFVVKLDPSGATLWAASIGGTGGSLGVNDEYATAIAVDPAGNVYVSGKTDSGSITVGNTATMSSNLGGFAAKLSGADGAGQWVVMMSSSNNGISNGCNGIAASATVVALGCTFDGNTVTWTGGGPVTNQDNPSNFLADFVIIGLDPGTHATKWANGVGGKGTSDGILGLGADASGDVLFAGNISASSAATTVADSLASINIARPANSQRDALFGRLAASNGKQVWTKLYAGTKDTSAYSIGADPKSSIVGLGGLFGNVDLGKGVVASTGINDAFLVGFDSTSKTAQYAKTIGGTANNQPEYTRGIAFDSWGEAIAVGTHQSTDTTADGKPIAGPPSNNNAAAFIVKYAPGGTVLWAKGVASGNSGEAVTASSVAVVASSSELRVGGNWKGTVALDGTNPVSSSGNTTQAFVMGLSP